MTDNPLGACSKRGDRGPSPQTLVSGLGSPNCVWTGYGKSYTIHPKTPCFSSRWAPETVPAPRGSGLLSRSRTGALHLASRSQISTR